MGLERFPPSARTSTYALPENIAMSDHSSRSVRLDYRDTPADGPNERLRRPHVRLPQYDTLVSRDIHTTPPMSQLVNLHPSTARKTYIRARRDLYPGRPDSEHKEAFYTEWAMQCARNEADRADARENARLDANALQHARL
ncbi:MAG: hypothetical protein Q9173_002554, partial [Seirophora scorigena]